MKQLINDINLYVKSIQDEIREDNPDLVNVDFWCFKIQRRIKQINNQKTKSSCTPETKNTKKR